MVNPDMITITLRLSESLLSIFGDKGSPMQEIIKYKTTPGITVTAIIAEQGIHPLLVPMVAITTPNGQKRMDKDRVINTDTELILYGPLAGG